MRFTCLQLLFGDALALSTYAHLDGSVGSGEENRTCENCIIRSMGLNKFYLSHSSTLQKMMELADGFTRTLSLFP